MIPSRTCFIHLFSSIWTSWYMCIAEPWGGSIQRGLLDIPLVKSLEVKWRVDWWEGQSSYFSALDTDVKGLISPRSKAGTSDEESRFSFGTPLLNRLTTACSSKLLKWPVWPPWRWSLTQEKRSGLVFLCLCWCLCVHSTLFLYVPLSSLIKIEAIMFGI